MDHEDLWFGRLVFDLSFFAIVVIVLLQGVVFGIIIDTFGTLRDEEKDKRNDMTSKCFICGISRDEFDRHGEGFLNHIKADHNVRMGASPAVCCEFMWWMCVWGV
jgi:hypothetical protein